MPPVRPRGSRTTVSTCHVDFQPIKTTGYQRCRHFTWTCRVDKLTYPQNAHRKLPRCVLQDPDLNAKFTPLKGTASYGRRDLIFEPPLYAAPESEPSTKWVQDGVSHSKRARLGESAAFALNCELLEHPIARVSATINPVLSPFESPLAPALHPAPRQLLWRRDLWPCLFASHSWKANRNYFARL